jgi:hypothetical protein
MPAINMDGDTLARALGWDGNVIKKLAKALSKHPDFAQFHWPDAPLAFHNTLIAALSQGDLARTFDRFVSSPAFDFRNSSKKDCARSYRKFSILGRLTARAMERIATFAEIPIGKQSTLDPALLAHIHDEIIPSMPDFETVVREMSHFGMDDELRAFAWIADLILDPAQFDFDDSDDDVDPAAELADDICDAALEVHEAYGLDETPVDDAQFRNRVKRATEVLQLLQSAPLQSLTAKASLHVFAQSMAGLLLDLTNVAYSIRHVEIVKSLRHVGIMSDVAALVESAEAIAKSIVELDDHSAKEAIVEMLELLSAMLHAVADSWERQVEKDEALHAAVRSGQYDELSRLSEDAKRARATADAFVQKFRGGIPAISGHASKMADHIAIARYTQAIHDVAASAARSTQEDVARRRQAIPPEERPDLGELPTSPIPTDAEASHHPDHVSSNSLSSATTAPSATEAPPARTSEPTAARTDPGVSAPAQPQPDPAQPELTDDLPRTSSQAEASVDTASLIEPDPADEVPIDQVASAATSVTELPRSQQAKPFPTAPLPERPEDDPPGGTPIQLTATEGCISACRDRRFDVAYWLSWLADHNREPGWSHAAFASFVFGLRVRPGGYAPAELIEHLGRVAAGKPDARDRAFITSALLPPVLFCAEKDNALYALRSVANTGLPHFDALAERVFDFGLNKTLHLTPNDVLASGIVTDHTRELSALADDSAQTLAKTRGARMAFTPGESLLHALYRDGQPLHTVHRIVEGNDPTRLAELTAILDSLSAERLADSYELAPNLLPGRCPPMAGPARVRFVKYINTTLSIGRRWAEITETLHGAEDSFRKKEVETLRDFVRKSAGSALSEIRAAKGGASPDYVAALIAAETTVEVIAAVLRGESPASGDDIYTLLTPHPAVALDDDFYPAPGSEEALVVMLEQHSHPDPIASVRESVRRHEFIRARHLIARYALPEPLADEVDDALSHVVKTIAQQIDDLETSVEDAYILGKLTEFTETPGESGRAGHASRSDLLGNLVAAKAALAVASSDPEPRLQEIETRVRAVESVIKEIREETRAAMRARSESLAMGFPQTPDGQEDAEYFRRHFADALAADDHVAAGEILHQASQSILTGSRIPLLQAGQCGILREFERCEPGIVALLESSARTSLEDVIEAVRTGNAIGPLGLSHCDPQTRETIANAAEAILRFREPDTTRIAHSTIPAILGGVDFPITSGSAKVKDQPADYRVVDYELQHTPSCPVPAFGSGLGRRVTVLFVTRRHNEDDLRNLAARLNLRRKPVLVISPFPLPMASRLRMRALSIADQIEMLLIDPVVLLYVMAQRQRLQALYETTLPFTFTQPYQLKGELVPKETFVGRETEVRSLIDRDGACIVFGGRQLGKSATLRHLVTNYHDPAGGHYFAYRDIDDLAAGTDPYDRVRLHFWEIVASELRSNGFADVPQSNGRTTYRSLEETVTNAIRERMRRDPGLRLTILLDEADDLITADAQEDFGIIKTVRALMVDTDRRCKIVFAGLQSVQLYSRWPNHPFAQLGREIVINPLPPEAAQRLIVQPMRALGFEFETPELVLRLLSTVNYHPGLVQIVAHKLLAKQFEKITRTKRIEGASRTITRADIQEIERSREVVDDIRDRFTWTLALDDRYSIVIYALVLSGNPTTQRTEEEFLRLGRYWWPGEFANLDQSGIRALLEELEGLGILVRTDAGGQRTYQLRSPNLLRLLGTRGEIENDTQRLIAQQSRRKANPREFRSLITGKVKRFSPLSMGQEAEIFSGAETFAVTLVFGSSATGLPQVEETIARVAKANSPEWSLIRPDRPGDLPVPLLAEAARKHLAPTARGHRYLAASIAPAEGVSQAVKVFAESCKGTCKKASKGRVFLLGGPDMLWTWLVEKRRLPATSLTNPNEIILPPWSEGAVVRALELGAARNLARRNGAEILERTGGFHSIVARAILGTLDDESSQEAFMASIDRAIEEITPDQMQESVGFMSLPPALLQAVRTYFPLGLEVADGVYTIKRSALGVLLGELGRDAHEQVFGDLGQEAAIDILVQWLTMTSAVRGFGKTRDELVVPKIVAERCFKG